MHYNIDTAYRYELFFILLYQVGSLRLCIITVPVERVALIWNLLQFAMYVKNTYVGFVANVSKRMTLFTDITIV